MAHKTSYALVLSERSTASARIMSNCSSSPSSDSNFCSVITCGLHPQNQPQHGMEHIQRSMKQRTIFRSALCSLVSGYPASISPSPPSPQQCVRIVNADAKQTSKRNATNTPLTFSMRFVCSALMSSLDLPTFRCFPPPPFLPLLPMSLLLGPPLLAHLLSSCSIAFSCSHNNAGLNPACEESIRSAAGTSGNHSTRLTLPMQTLTLKPQGTTHARTLQIGRAH